MNILRKIQVQRTLRRQDNESKEVDRVQQRRFDQDLQNFGVRSKTWLIVNSESPGRTLNKDNAAGNHNRCEETRRYRSQRPVDVLHRVIW